MHNHLKQLMQFYVHCFLYIFSLFINGKRKWARFDMRGKLLDQTEALSITNEWEILSMFNCLVDDPSSIELVHIFIMFSIFFFFFLFI